MKANSPILMAVVVALGLSFNQPTNALPLFNSGSATLTFDPGAGSPTVVNVNPIPTLLSTQLSDTYNSGGLLAAGQGGINHGESASHFGLSFAGNSGVSQTDTSGLVNGAAVLTISFSSLWDFTSQFGPTAYGYANFPSIVGEVAPGAGSFAMFELVGNFSGGATRSQVNYSFTWNTPGSFSTSIFDVEDLTPNFIAADQSETISGYIRFTARGVDGLSSSSLGNVLSGTIPVPEPEVYAGVAGLALAGFACLRRRFAAKAD
jgi:hypothetical protein